jgi:hypothetical protein
LCFFLRPVIANGSVSSGRKSIPTIIVFLDIINISVFI